MANNMDGFLDNKEVFENLKDVKNIIVIMSGKGGVGKSTVAVNLATGFALNGMKTGLLDIDLHGPSVPKMAGISGKEPFFIENRIVPVKVSENLITLSTGLLNKDEEQPFIWRGPMKMSVIKQFLKDTEWGELDYLVVDCPPGTGDESLSLLQMLPGLAKVIIVTTPQQVSLLDVKKSIKFCKDLNTEILGVVENMSGFYCPDCKTYHAIFMDNGAKSLGLEMLAELPLDPEIVKLSDEGKPFIYFAKDDNVVKIRFEKMIDTILNNTNKKTETNNNSGEKNNMTEKTTKNTKKIAIPVAQGNVCLHFGHCEKFFIAITEENGNIQSSELLDPPVHEPGVLPKWLGEQNVNLIIAGGMGSRAQTLFNDNGIEVITGVGEGTPEEIIAKYYNNTLEKGVNYCDH
ncbi:MAG: P-loop NTPase [Candidatus Muirbacterium halophilum]|nr:P-loop NTPase [Candidatus Muirbacterium halophilum]MCK9476012.1 P-loop NTPase [Candidatus Muirbacterium halophilum]